jgi:hypothetical protein
MSDKLTAYKAALNYGGIVNFTPHAVTVAGVTYQPSGIVARIDDEYTEIVDGTCTVSRGKVKFLKDGQEFHLNGFDVEGTVHIVSAMVWEALRNTAYGVWVAPATGHPDVVRNEKGHIISVPAFLL